MTPEIMRQYLAAHAPESRSSSCPRRIPDTFARVESPAAQVAKTLTLRVGEDAIIVGDLR